MAGELVFAGIAPHPPLLVPEVGGTRIDRVQASAEALAKFAEDLLTTRPETVVVVSPHSPGDGRNFGAFSDELLRGDFRQFGAPQAALSFPNDLELLDSLQAVAREREIRFAPFASGYPLDHGVMVPMYYIHQAGWTGPLLALSFTSLPRSEHLKFGRACIEAAGRIRRNIAFVASADLSHYLSADGPYGLRDQAYVFDQRICGAIADNNLQAIVDIDEGLQQWAGECGYRSILIAVGALGDSAALPRLLSYECPYGVGYPVAVLKEERR